MAFFGVTLEEISEVRPVPDSERLSVARMKGISFEFVIGRDEFKPGDQVLYFPLDALMSDFVMEKLPLLKGKLAGAKANRVKTAKLRGQISQGVVADPKLFLTEEQIHTLSSREITDLLGIEKYEPPIIMSNDAFFHQLPQGHSAYDIEGADRYQWVVEVLLEKKVVVREKLEGTNFSCGVELQEDGSFKTFVSQRNHTIVEKEGIENSFWRAARKNDLLRAVEEEKITLYGELIGPGIQKNIYNLKEHEVHIFDMKKNGQWLNDEEFNKIISRHPHIKVAPLIFRGKLKDFLKDKTIQQMADGTSILNPKMLREGIVITPLIEEEILNYGRLKIKQRGPVYLSKEKD